MGGTKLKLKTGPSAGYSVFRNCPSFEVGVLTLEGMGRCVGVGGWGGGWDFGRK